MPDNDAYEAFRKELVAANIGEGGAQQSPGFKFFSNSACAVYRTASWMAGLKMHTRHIVGTEIINEDNFFGGHIADGGLFTLVSGREYDDVYPLWNWRCVPGITSFPSLPPSSAPWDKRNASDFVRAAALSPEIAAVAMVCDREGLVSRKIWVFTDRFILCVGASISSDRAENVVTTVEQNLFAGSAFIRGDDGWKPLSQRIEKSGSDAVRLFHANIGYVLCGGDVFASVEDREGDFVDFMRSGGSIKRKGRIFECGFSHGAAPRGAVYQYFVLPASTPDATAAFDPAAEAVVSYESDGSVRISLPSVGSECVVVWDGPNAGVAWCKKAGN